MKKIGDCPQFINKMWFYSYPITRSSHERKNVSHHHEENWGLSPIYKIWQSRAEKNLSHSEMSNIKLQQPIHLPHPVDVVPSR